MANYYCSLQSSGNNYTNLQLYSLLQAWRLWKEVDAPKRHESPGKIRERCGVVIILLGSSLYQLLGQNCPGNEKSRKTPAGKALLNCVLEALNIKGHNVSELTSRFDAFVDVYDAFRHFGQLKHETIDRVTIEATREYVETTLMIWNVLCTHFDVRLGNMKEFLDDELLRDCDYDSE